MDIIYGRGVCRASEALNLAETAGIISRSGAWYSLGDERIGQGRENVREQLASDPALLQRVLSLLAPMPSEPAAAK